MNIFFLCIKKELRISGEVVDANRQAGGEKSDDSIEKCGSKARLCMHQKNQARALRSREQGETSSVSSASLLAASTLPETGSSKGALATF